MSQMNVLVVDDDAPLREFVAHFLTDAGADVRAAADGAEALRMVAQARPDAMVLDLDMPVLDGFEVLERLRADGANANVAVIILTGNDDRESVERGLALGADGYLFKPFAAWDLEARLNAALKMIHDRTGQLPASGAR